MPVSLATMSNIAAHPVQQAIWFVEQNLGKDIALDDIARAAGVSRFHLTRAFGLATGQSLMRYVRARRLSEAAQRLAAGASDILALALDAGYGSHEAFTRAFGDHFGLAPQALRDQGSVVGIQLTAPLKLDESLTSKLAEPRYEDRQPFLLAGLNERYSYETSQAIPSQWQQFAQEFAPAIASQSVNSVAYGVLHNSDGAGNMDYLCGLEVRDFNALPVKGVARLRVPRQNYAVFAHQGHVSAIRRTWYTIWNRWLPGSGFEVSAEPEFESYGEHFDPLTGFGDIAVWLPINHPAGSAGDDGVRK